ncbi:MAG: hypothetical protein OXN85_09905 [Gemmatimonadetes bacterium]|nr:hypothetical protein [Candidatus Palauibacter australiensis]
MSENGVASAAGSAFLWRVGALGAGASGIVLLATDGAPLTLAVLLLIAALAAAGVLLGGGAHGAAVEGGLDLSARLGLGLLGGLLGAAVSAAARSVVATFGSIGAVSMGLTSGWTGAEFLSHLGSGAVWGLMLGVLYTYLSGSPAARGATFALAPTLYVVIRLGLGEPALDFARGDLPLVSALALYVGRGVFAVFSILAVNVLWGAIAGATLGWGEAGDETPVARPIDE